MARGRVSMGRGVAVGSPAATPPRMNNDKAEKIRRRKRRRTVLMKDGIMQGMGGGGRVSGANGLRKPRKSILPPPLLSGIQLTDLYSNCLKMSAENKINQKNTWGLDLIDYIDDIVEEDETDFARASCTIDASIKIYSTRVDAVHLDTYKVLGGLSRTGGGEEEEGGDGGGGGGGAETDGDESDDDDAYTEGRRKKKKEKKKRDAAKGGRKCATIEHNRAALDTSELDLAFDIDPLFQKTSAEFDEGGARGLLLNNLSIAANGQLVLGSHGDGEGADHSLAAADGALPAMVDLGELHKVYGAPEYHTLELCPEFVQFAEAAWGRAPASGPSAAESAAAAAESAAEAEAARATFFSAMASAATADDFAWDEGDFDDDDSDDDNGDAPAPLGDSGLSLGMSSFSSASTQAETLAAVFGPGRADATAASALDAVLKMTKDGGASEYAFFAPAKVKGWAGPAHWKFSGKARSGAGSGAKKPKKAAFYLDLTPPLAIDFAALGATSSKSTSLKASTMANKAKDAYLLPKDIHYDIAELTHFALRPAFSLVPTRTGDAGQGSSAAAWLAGGGGGDESDDDNGDYWPGAVGGDGDEYGLPELGGSVAGEVTLIDAPRKVDKVDLKYNRVASRVDVKALKRGVWAELTEDDPRDALVSNAPAANVIPPGKDIKFSDVCANLPNTLPRRVMADASVQFAFICLLHLCNEKGLEIESDGSLTDFTVRQDAKLLEPKAPKGAARSGSGGAESDDDDSDDDDEYRP